MDPSMDSCIIQVVLLPQWQFSFPMDKWVWINTYFYTIFRGMNIHKSQLFWCELQGYKVLTHCQMHKHALLISAYCCFSSADWTCWNYQNDPECKHQTLICGCLKHWPFHSMDYHHYPFTICWSSFFGRSFCHVVTKIGHDDGFPYFSHRYVGYSWAIPPYLRQKNL